MTRSIARVKQSVNPTAHWEGAPPGVLATSEQTALPDAAWVVMEMKAEGVFLIRYSKTGEFAGDTWTPTRELALEVATDEYGLAESDWIDVPDGTPTPSHTQQDLIEILSQGFLRISGDSGISGTVHPITLLKDIAPPPNPNSHSHLPRNPRKPQPRSLVT